MIPPRVLRGYLLWSKDRGFLSVSPYRASVRGPRDREYTVKMLVGPRLKAKPHQVEQQSPLKRTPPPRKPHPHKPSHAVTNMPRPAFPIRTGGIQMTLTEWNSHVKRRRLLDLDGYGRCVVDGRERLGKIRPSTARKILPRTTHINWYPAFHAL